eukprot:TRINITY_DN7018_c3_g1_i1.p1 TRINITY_DN7018_c3_g1~~TRINITY_DN7018_c3_g1_i1.p1  ORF type:complete len:212 (+),score=28.06 TRINITY_DN7018_c3_g1_i1:55-636(+)
MFEFSEIENLQPVSDDEMSRNLKCFKSLKLTPYCIRTVNKLNSKFGSETRVLLLASLLAGTAEDETVIFSCTPKSNIKRVIWIYNIESILLLPAAKKETSMRIVIKINKERDYVFDAPTNPTETVTFLNTLNNLWKQRTESDADLKVSDLRKELSIKYKRDKAVKPKVNIGMSIARMRWPKHASLNEMLSMSS